MRSEEQKKTSRFDAAECARLAKARSFGGKYKVVFGHYPEYPDFFEFISHPNDLPRTVYINLDSAPSANVSFILER